MEPLKKRTKTYPKDMDPDVIVFPTAGGEHSIVAPKSAVVAGGLVGGCEGQTIANIINSWIRARQTDRHIWIVPEGSYSAGCFNYSLESNVETHFQERNSTPNKSLSACLKDFQIASDEKVAAYLRGYLELWIIPLGTPEKMAEFGFKALDFGVQNLGLKEYSFELYSGSRHIGKIGEGNKTYHLHLGTPPILR